MDEKQFWDFAFISVAAMRFHPKNDNMRDPEQEIEIAAKTANMMLIQRKLRWLG